MRRAWIPLSVIAALLALALLLAAPPAGAQVTGTNDYDTDDDRLIEIDSLAKLNAIRYDANGDGLRGTVSTADWNANHNASGVFDDPLSNQCPTSCQGYELTADLTFPTSGTYSSWTPIASYAAILDGQGHTLTGLTVSATTESHTGAVRRSWPPAPMCGMWGWFNPSVTLTFSSTRGVGGLAGYIRSGAQANSSYVSGGTITLAGTNLLRRRPGRTDRWHRAGQLLHRHRHLRRRPRRPPGGRLGGAYRQRLGHRQLRRRRGDAQHCQR